MSAPPSPRPHPRPRVDYEQGYSQEEENWSDDPSNEQDEPEVPRRKTRHHVLPSRLGTPGGQTVPYGHHTPRQGYGNPFAPAPGLDPRPYNTSDQQYSYPTGGFPQGSEHYAAGQSGTSYIPAPYSQPNHYSQNPYHSDIPAGAPPFGYTPIYQPPVPQQFDPPFTDRPTSRRLPSLRVRTSRREEAESDREADEQRRREYNRRRERERKEAERKQREQDKKEREQEKKQREQEKKQREQEKKELDRAQRDKLRLKVQRLQLQLELERSKRSGSGAVESIMKDLVDHLHEQENRRRGIEKRADPVAQLLQGLAELADTRRVDPYQHDRLPWPGGFSPKPRPPTRSDFSDVSYDTVHRSRIEELVVDILRRWTASDEQEKDRLPLPPASQTTARAAREDYRHTDDRSPRGPPPDWQDEEGGAASPRSRFGDTPGDFNDAYRGPSSPHHRFGDTPRPMPSVPELERRQAAAPANIKVAMSSFSKRTRGSDLGSEYPSAADRGSFPIPESQDTLPRRTEPGRRGEPRRSESHRSPGRRSSQSGPRPASSRGMPSGVRHGSRNSIAEHAVSFEDEEDPVGVQPIADMGEYVFSGSDTEDEARGPRRARPYRVTGEKVQGHRYNPRDDRGLTPPPEAPDVPRSEAAERVWRAAGGSERITRRVARVDSWSDDEQEKRR